MDIPFIIIWFILGIILLSVELIAPGVFAIFFVAASFVTGLISLVIDNLLAQMAIFTLTSFIIIIFGKPFLQKFFHVNKVEKNSTIDALIGKEAIITQSFANGERSLVKVDGEVWSAKGIDNNLFLEGERVIIKRIEGVTAVVEKINKKGE